MKKLLTLSVLAAALATPAFATPTATESKPAAATAQMLELKNGTKIEVMGEKVSVLNADGTKTPAPDGMHELKDGSKVTTKGGMMVK